MWIVMTSSAKMPSKVKAPYRNVALVKLRQDYVARDLQPKMISDRAVGVVRILHMGHYFVGLTPKCAYKRALVSAYAQAAQLNNLPEAPLIERVTLGGSA